MTDEDNEIARLYAISIHMPHTWHDVLACLEIVPLVLISIHMPHTWHDVFGVSVYVPRSGFQSTCHIRGMTSLRPVSYFAYVISIHMPHTWHDPLHSCRSACLRNFNPHATYVA